MKRTKSISMPPNFTVSIVGNVWTVCCYLRQDMPEFNWGFTDKLRRVIAIRWDCDDDVFASTFFHECFHAACHTIDQLPDTARSEEVLCDLSGAANSEITRQLLNFPKVVQARLLRPRGQKVIDGVSLPYAPNYGEAKRK